MLQFLLIATALTIMPFMLLLRYRAAIARWPQPGLWWLLVMTSSIGATHLLASRLL